MALAVALAASAAPARADVSTLEGVASPVVRITLRQGAITIRTWDRDAVAIDADPSVVVQRRPYRGPEEQSQSSLPIPAAGTVGSDAYLAAESFVPAPFPPVRHEAIVIRSEAGTVPGPVVVTVPRDTPLIFAIARAGPLDVHDYRGGTLIAYTSFGRLTLDDVGGTVFAQSGRGPIVATDSTFERIRVRSVAGNVTFERCVSKQIETTTIGGSIVYDGGSFQPGLARFESRTGDVAIGSEAAAQISAHTASGRVFTNFQHPAQIDGHDGETQATVQGGGPLVNATSQSGDVFLYDGSLRTRAMSPEWQAPTAILQRPGLRRENLKTTPPPARAPSPPKFRWAPPIRRVR